MDAAKIFGLFVLLFVVYYFAKDRLWRPTAETFEVPAPAAAPIQAGPYAPTRIVAPAGPNPPAQAAPVQQATFHAPAAPTDPLAEPHQAAFQPDTVRNPETAFEPAVKPRPGLTPVQAGVASLTQGPTPNNIQSFGLDTIQNSGEFIQGGVFANDTTLPTNYSAF